MEGTLPVLVNNLSLSAMGGKSQYDMMRFMLGPCGSDLCEVIFNSTVVKDLRNTTKKYDLLVTELFGTDCVLGFSHLFEIPVVVLTSSVNLPWASDRFGNPDNPSYIPNYFVSYVKGMTVVQRLINTISLIGAKIR